MGRLRGILWLFAGLVMAGMAGIVAFVTISRAAPAATGTTMTVPMVSVVVARGMTTARSVLTAENLDLKQVPVDSVAEGAVAETEDAVGYVTLTELFPGEVILAQRLVDPNEISGDGRVALALAADQVLVAIPTDNLLSNAAVLKPGDHVDIYASLDFERDQLVAAADGSEATQGSTDKQQATFCVLENVEIVSLLGSAVEEASTGGGILGGKASSAGQASDTMLVTLSPQDAMILKYVRDAGGIQDIVLRAPGVDNPFGTEPVDAEYLIHRYSIPTGSYR